MKFYRVHLTEVEMSSHGYEFYTSRREAEAKKREWESEWKEKEAHAYITEIEVTPTKAGILMALNQYADHPNNG